MKTTDPEAAAIGLGRNTRMLPCVLWGSRRGPRRPRIVLARESPGFNDPSNPKYVVHFSRRGRAKRDGARAVDHSFAPNGSFDQLFVGIDVEIGRGNAGAVAIRHRGAQGSGVQDCTIDARHGYCGLEGGCGSGGGHFNVTVVGGRIGSGRQSVWRSVEVREPVCAQPEWSNEQPAVLISGNGGGRWYNFHAGGGSRHGREYRHLVVRGTRQPLRMYQLNVEHAGDRSLEVDAPPNAELIDARNVEIFGLKCVGTFPALRIRGSDHVWLFG